MHNIEETVVSQSQILARRKRCLGKTNRKSFYIDRQGHHLRKLIRANINDIYFFGRFSKREELARYVWR